MSHYLFNWPIFEARAEIQKYFCSFVGANENFEKSFQNKLIFKWLLKILIRLSLDRERRKQMILTYVTLAIHRHIGQVLIAKVHSNLVSYFIHMRLDVNGLILVQKTKQNVLKKINSMKGLVSVHFFFIKIPNNVESHV